MSELPKTFDPASIEQRWYAHWESNGLFRPDRPDAQPWTIVMPPPNVTGSLHIGHALDNTLQDVLTRRERMLGKDALWVVGTDHAGIATQMVVERNLESQGIRRAEIGREAFLEHVWEWKAQSGGAITRQLRRLGASCDWAHERFTMDEAYQRAVIHTFVELYKRDLIYRDKRLVNWDPKFQSAISDLEVETRDVQGKFWTLSYQLADNSGAIQVATTRPETMLADMAVAVHPEDERYKALIGKDIRHPITGRLIPIVADEHADPELGSGAVKITPGHDFNDFEVGKRAGFRPGDMLNMFDAQAFVVQTQDGLIPQNLLGLSREEARKAVIAKLEDEGALVRVEDRVIPTPFGDRSGVVIEPWLTDQWYVDAAKLALPALQAVKKGDIRVVPETWKKTWYNWLENIQPWCVSRQLWWGHRIPAWYAEDGHVFVAESEEEARAQAGGKPVHQDEDVLDTWFSSALWPFATLGWPDETEDLRRHYPNDVLISGFDILFFWDARMAMQGIEFMGGAPWKTLYLHGLVRDAQGAKMSKSKGNTVDPLGLIDKYGADALRFTLAAMESQGRDIKLDEKRVEGYRNFATKLWNAARFLQMNGVGASDTIAAPAAELPVNRWIIGEVVETLAKLDRAFDELRYDEVADAIYHFVWGTFCDWYVELVKPLLSPSPSGEGTTRASGSGVGEPNEAPRPHPNPSPEGEGLEETRTVAAWAFDQILVMLHPLMPFITEELWHAMPRGGDKRPYDLIVAKWPEPQAQVDFDARAEMKWLISLTQNLRAAKAELGIAPGSRLEAYLPHPGPPVRGISGYDLVARNAEAIDRMARLSAIHFDEAPKVTAMQVAALDTTFIVPLEGVIDIEAEIARLNKAAAAAEKERDSLAQRLSNPNFTERAKPEAVEKARADHEAKAAEAERLRAALERLG
jgi:valyl-tRNA synthetase